MSHFTAKVVVLRALDDERTHAMADECGICLERLDEKPVISATSCEHRFHDGCLSEWLTSNASCPLCRARVEPERQQQRQQQQQQQQTLHKAWTSKSGYPAVTRSHKCKCCMSTCCITQRPLCMPDGMQIGTSHYECDLCGEIYDTHSRVPWVATSL